MKVSGNTPVNLLFWEPKLAPVIALVVTVVRDVFLSYALYALLPTALGRACVALFAVKIAIDITHYMCSDSSAQDPTRQNLSSAFDKVAEE